MALATIMDEVDELCFSSVGRLCTIVVVGGEKISWPDGVVEMGNVRMSC